jgi:ABC 3 transport family/Heavy metal associated domain 2
MSRISRLRLGRSSIAERKAMWNLHEDISRRRDPHRGLRLRSAVPGRIRWEVEALRNRPRNAAAVAMALRQRVGIHSVEATPLTGRLLVYHDIGLTAQEIAAMVQAALRASALAYAACEIRREAPALHGKGEIAAGRVHVNTQDRCLTLTEVPWRGYWYRSLQVYMALMRRVPVHLQGMLFVLILALAVAQSWLAIGVLWLFSLVIIPMTTAGLLTARLTPLLIYWMGFASWSVWLGFWLAAQGIWMPTVFIAMSSLALHLGVRWLVVKVGRAPRLPVFGQRQLFRRQLGS